MGKYIRDQDVIDRVIGKVRFTDDLNDENQMSFTLLRRLISEGEGEVELDLSPRYAVPLVTMTGSNLSTLANDNYTRNTIRTLCELKSVERVLETDFGSGTIVNADKYVEKLNKRYKSILSRLMARWEDEEKTQKKGWKYPPLLGLQLNYFNTEADDGYLGMVLSTSMGVGDFPSKNINNPEETFWNTLINEHDPLVRLK